MMAEDDRGWPRITGRGKHGREAAVDNLSETIGAASRFNRTGIDMID